MIFRRNALKKKPWDWGYNGPFFLANSAGCVSVSVFSPMWRCQRSADLIAYQYAEHIIYIYIQTYIHTYVRTYVRTYIDTYIQTDRHMHRR